MASNKNFMNFISNEVAKKNLSDNPVVKFALKDFYNNFNENLRCH